MAKNPDRAVDAQHMDVPAIAKIAFTSEDRVREVIHNFNRDGFDSLAPKYAGAGRLSSAPPSGPRSSRSLSAVRPITARRPLMLVPSADRSYGRLSALTISFG